MSGKVDYVELNSKIIDECVNEGWKWGTPITSEEFNRAKNGEWKIKLSITKYIPREWFGELKDKNVLGLAAGGGQQIPILSAFGAKCTLLDYSIMQLKTDAMVASREGYKVNLIKYDMTKRLPFDDNSFDIIIFPACSEFIEKVEPVFRECYRILKKGGILLCGLINPMNYIVDDNEEKIVHSLPFNPLRNKEHEKILLKRGAGYQFSHTVAEQIGGQLKAGFILTHVEDDTNGEGRLHELNIPTYMVTRAIK